VTPQQLRHTFATQLVNAGCRITSIQQLLGHRNISTTLVYARVRNQTVAEDYFAAMELIEKRLDPTHQTSQLPTVAEYAHLLALLDSERSPGQSRIDLVKYDYPMGSGRERPHPATLFRLLVSYSEVFGHRRVVALQLSVTGRYAQT
jgi:hypothetical protein